jgi:hypothetical protein
MRHSEKRRSDSATNDILPVIGSIIEAVRSCDITSLEKQRFGDDLITLKQRLTSREYLQSSFKPRNQLSIPERTEEFYKDLTFFFSVGKVWETLLGKLKKSTIRSVLDIGPGYFPKVELGLYYSGYKGAVTLLDQDCRATESAEKFLTFFNCPFSVRCCHTSILSAPRATYDLIVANHFLDDFGLASHCSDQHIDIKEAYLSEKIYQSLWNDIARNPASALAETEKLAATFSRLLAVGGTVLLLDYTSFSHRAMGLTAIPTFVKKMKRKLLSELSRQGLAPRSLIARPIRFDRLQVDAEDLICVTKIDRRKI